MATKINTTYYGAESSWTANSSWGDDCKRADSQHTFLQLAKNGELDLANEGNINFSAVPWGVPRCSLTNHSYPLHLAAGADGDFNGFYKPINEDLDDKNNPLVIVTGGGSAVSYESGQNTTLARAYQKRRVIGKTAVSGNNLVSTLGADNGSNINSGADYNESVITYLNYQTTKVIIDKVYLIDKDSVVSGVTATQGNLLTVSFDYLTSEAYEDKWICVGVSCKFVVNNNLASDGTLHPVFANPHKTPLHIRKNYSNDTMQTWVQYHRNVIKSFGRTDNFNVNQSSPVTYADVNTKASNSAYACNGYGTMYCNTSAKQQVFDDVTYKWDMRARYASGNIVLWIKDGEALTDSVKFYNVLDIPDNSADKISQAIMHEVAFLGFPFVVSADYINEPIGSTYVHLPVFDYEHMITTGKYVRGADALQLNNALWGNIFDDNIPPWDSTYEPPDTEEQEKDYGDTSNRGGKRGRFPSELNVYLLSSLEYRSFIGELNAYYSGLTPDDWTLDFQGVNPSDYILSAYYTPYNFIKSETKTGIQIGNITLTTTAYTLSQGQIGIDPPDKWQYFTYGTRTITPSYGDFRDYSPYTEIDLYLPFAGTVPLETAYCMGHDITVEYYFDVLTMSGVACVYRDNMLYKTSDFKLGCQIPVLSTNMGSVQNQISQLEVAQKQNAVRLATGALAVAGGIGATIATGGAALPALVATGTGLLGIASGAEKANELDYQLSHTAPTVAQTGAAEPINNFCVGQLMPKLIIKRPLMLNSKDDTIYAHTIGNACCINNVLGDNKGLTVCSKADLSGLSATAAEISAIQSLLTGGIYV